MDLKSFFDSNLNFLISSDLLTKALVSIVIIIGLTLLRKFLMQAMLAHTTSVEARYQWQKISRYTYAIALVIFIGPLWISGFGGAATYLGLLSAGLAIAMQKVILNLAAWVYILSTKLFSVGDRIQIKNFSGDVVDISLLKFSMLEVGNWVDADQSTGRILHIPNGLVFEETLANYSSQFQFIWNEIPVTITFESDWKTAKKLLVEIAEQYGQELTQTAHQQIAQNDGSLFIHYQKLTPTVYTRMVEKGIQLTLRYICEPRQRRISAEHIWEAILIQLTAHPNIHFAVPPLRIPPEESNRGAL